ncbi:MAG: transcription elongation factor GreA [Candidatus Pacebacteria bacterium]|nr:transcription elongation factor GreA [Candidatus Paceibacterota bacterium]
MENETEYLSQEKFDEFQKELEYLKKTRRKEIAENLEYAKSLGDLSENAEYQEAREMQANTEDRIARLENLLKTAQIISGKKSDVVVLGSVATVQHLKDKQESVYTIVGSEEADISVLKISTKSPFGVAILGKKKGEIFSFATADGINEYRVVKVK